MTTFSGSIPTVAAGDNATVADDLAVYRDALKALSEQWTAFAPTPTNFTVGNGALTGRYAQIGKLIHFRVNFNAGSTSSYTGSPATVSLPAAAHASGEQAVFLKIYTGATNYSGNANIAAGASVATLYVPTSTANPSLVVITSGTTNPGTTGNVVIEGTYEAA